MASKAQIRALCAQIAFLRAFGYTNAETAGRVSTQDHPSGIAEKTLYNHAQQHRAELEALVSWANLSKREKQVASKELTAETLREEMAAELGTSWASVKSAILDGDSDMAVWHIEQVIGKAKSNLDVKHSGAVLHGHIAVQQDAELTAKQDKEIEESQRMARAILLGTKDAIEAEVIESAP